VIIHGDIKPRNILIFEDNEHRFIAKIADFGSSSTSESEEDMCQLPRSDPWNAPEYNHRKISTAAAKKMDTYSFAMLCVWFLLDGSHGAGDAESAVKVLRQMKETNNFKDKACELIESSALEDAVADKLAHLFRMTLVEDPFERTLGMQDLAELLNPDRYAMNTIW
jgi:serine/threonine protein kinase